MLNTDKKYELKIDENDKNTIQSYSSGIKPYFTQNLPNNIFIKVKIKFCF